MTQGAFEHTGDSVHQNHRGKLPAGENKVAQRYFFVHNFVYHPLVNALVMSAEYEQVGLFGKLLKFFLIHGFALWRHEHNVGLSIPRDSFVALPYRLCHHKHSLTFAVGGVVNAVMLVKGVIADLVAVKLKDACVARPADYARR